MKWTIQRSIKKENNRIPQRTRSFKVLVLFEGSQCTLKVTIENVGISWKPRSNSLYDYSQSLVPCLIYLSWNILGFKWGQYFESTPCA